MQATFILNLTSDQPEKVISYYRDVVGLPPREGMGPDALAAGAATLTVETHRDIAGPAKQPSRFLIDFWVGDVAAEQKRMEAKGAEFSRTLGSEAWGGVISTFSDPDGNIGQVMQVPGGSGAPGEVTGFFLDITSEEPGRLFAFYRDVVGLEPFPAVGPHGLLASEGVILHVDTHSETKGPNPEPARAMLNFFVEDEATERARMEAAGARFFRVAGLEFWGGIISSCLDPDGNIVQLMQYDQSKDTTLMANAAS